MLVLIIAVKAGALTRTPDGNSVNLTWPRQRKTQTESDRNRKIKPTKKTGKLNKISTVGNGVGAS